MTDDEPLTVAIYCERRARSIDSQLVLPAPPSDSAVRPVADPPTA